MKFKRLSALFLSLAIIGGTTPTVNTIFEKPAIQANAISQLGDVLYEIKRNQLIVYAGSQSLTSVNVPSEINGLPVDALGSYSFANLYELTSITLPSTLKEIGVCSFYQCDALTSITCPDSLKVIANSAFYDCSYLESVSFNEGLETIGKSAFGYCKRLKDVIIPSTVSNIQEAAFQNNASMTKITILNPNCSIFDSAITFHPFTIICAPKGSTAEAYAKKYSRKFEAIEAPQTTETTTPAVTTTTTPAPTTTTTTTVLTTTTPEPTTTTTTTVLTTTTPAPTTTSTTTTNPVTTTTSTAVSTTTSNTVSTTTSQPVTKKIPGDANCDNIVDIADVVSIKFYIINSTKYSLSAQGIANADVQGNGNGLNSNDAIMIMKYCLALIPNFDI